MDRQVRSMPTKFETREDGNNLSIEGYFAVFDSNYDTTLVLGRTKAGTLQLRQDSHGLWGHIDINPNDGDAMNLYERVKRGDVDQCSFGFEIRSDDTDIKDDGSIHWTITDVNLFEVSCCTFPAYKETNISAREHDRDAINTRKRDAWRQTMLNKLKGEQ